MASWVFPMPPAVPSRLGIRPLQQMVVAALPKGLMFLSAKMAHVVAANPTRYGMHWNGMLRH